MGLITGILMLPLAPVRGAIWVAEQVANEAERQYYNPAPVEEALKSLEQELIAGQISEEEFDRREEELLNELDEIHRFWAEKQG
ncbi:gas vesicle protein GvpG [Kitasatospora sp. NPDC127111]|uniref:gas vesicle protein GvpG n=1 Tax=Kitasatospora sp. NPDC127111 TaxID=3345363 RepID=UPI003643F02D